jgi:NACHT domain
MQKSLQQVLEQMPEAQLTRQVVIPLLRAMFPGDRIEETHGPEEAGRDVICFTRHPHLQRSRIVCIQIKSHTLNRSTSSPYSIQTLKNQLELATTTGVVGLSGDVIKPTEIWVINSHISNDSFRRSIVQVLDMVRSMGAYYIDGEELANMLAVHCPSLAAELTDLADPALFQLISNLSAHKESRAFGLRLDRSILDFYVSASIFVGSARSEIFLEDEAIVRDIVITIPLVIQEEKLNEMARKGRGVVPEDRLSFEDIEPLWHAWKRWNLKISWQLVPTTSTTKHRMPGYLWVDRIYQVDFKSTASALGSKLSDIIGSLPPTLRGHEKKVKRALSVVADVEKFLTVCERYNGFLRLRRTERSGSESITVDSEQSLLLLDKVLLIAGGPGSGKTTLLRRVAINLLKSSHWVHYLECSRISRQTAADLYKLSHDQAALCLEGLVRFCSKVNDIASWKLRDSILIIDGLDEMEEALVPLIW